MNEKHLTMVAQNGNKDQASSADIHRRMAEAEIELKLAQAALLREQVQQSRYQRNATTND